METTPESTIAIDAVLRHEGMHSNDTADPGGETYMGISRRYWPWWPGWGVIDQARENGRPIEQVVELPVMARNFYLENFWTPIRGDVLAGYSQGLADKMLDIAVNMSVRRAVLWMQDALNVLSMDSRLYRRLVEDGHPGPRTMEALERYFSYDKPPHEDKVKMLVNILRVHQGQHYLDMMRRYPDRRKFRGLFLRI